jgi:ABC-type ATPase involved in cell division
VNVTVVILGWVLTASRTSGLDSSIALSVMQVLQDIAKTGRTVIGEL